MLHHITWHQYLAATLLAALIYYAFIIMRYYKPDIKRIISQISGNKDDGKHPGIFQYQPEENETAENELPQQNHDIAHSVYEQNEITAFDHFTGELKACIAKAADKPFAPAILIPQLKKILQLPREGIASVDRDSINAIIVNECEKTGTALLTEGEVDQWWSE